MIRIIMIVLRLLYKLPYYLFNLHKYKSIDKYDEATRYNFVRSFLKDVVHSANVDVVCKGIENLPKESGYLLTPNHQGLFDPVIIGLTHPLPLTAVAKIELIKTPIVRDIIEILEAKPMDRKDIRGSLKIIRKVSEELQQGRNYIIFPEGTRSKQGNVLLEFKGGSFKAATNAKKPIVPVACIDCYKVLDRNSVRKIKAQVHYLEPIYYDEYKEMSSVELAQMVQTRIQAKMDEVLK